MLLFIVSSRTTRVLPSATVDNHPSCKRRFCFGLLAPASSRLLLSLLGYSLLPESVFDRSRLDKSLHQIGGLLTKSTTVEQFNEENQAYDRGSLDDYELGRLLGCGCNAAVYEARLRTSSDKTLHLLTSATSFTNQDHDSESDIEILSRQSSDSSSFDDETYDHLDDEERLNELTLKEGRRQSK